MNRLAAKTKRPRGGFIGATPITRGKAGRGRRESQDGISAAAWRNGFNPRQKATSCFARVRLATPTFPFDVQRLCQMGGACGRGLIWLAGTTCRSSVAARQRDPALRIPNSRFKSGHRSVCAIRQPARRLNRPPATPPGTVPARVGRIARRCRPTRRRR